MMFPRFSFLCLHIFHSLAMKILRIFMKQYKKNFSNFLPSSHFPFPTTKPVCDFSQELKSFLSKKDDEDERNEDGWEWVSKVLVAKNQLLNKVGRMHKHTHTAAAAVAGVVWDETTMKI